MKKMKGIFGSFLVIIIAIVAGKYLANSSHTRANAVKPKTYENTGQRSDSLIDDVSKGLEVSVKEINEKAPFMIDENTRLDKVYVMPMATVVYEISFPFTPINEVDIDWITTDYKAELVGGACSSGDMISTIRRGGQFVYVLDDKYGEKIIEITVSQRECSALGR